MKARPNWLPRRGWLARIGSQLRRIGSRLRRVRLTNLRPHTRRGAGWVAVLLLAVLWFTRGGGQPTVSTWPRAEILAAIRFVESSDRDHVPDGDDGKAIGPYQIHRIYWLDAIEFAPELAGDYQDCRRRAYAERVIDAYMRRYAAASWHDGDGERIARIHNGGPKGDAKQATLGYWQRVRARLGAPEAKQ